MGSKFGRGKAIMLIVFPDSKSFDVVKWIYTFSIDVLLFLNFHNEMTIDYAFS